MLDRTIATAFNNMLNLELAIAIFEAQGIHAWTSMRKKKVPSQKVQSRRQHETQTITSRRTR